MEDRKPTLDYAEPGRKVRQPLPPWGIAIQPIRRIILVLWIANLVAIAAVAIYSYLSTGVAASVAFSNFRELVLKQVIDESKLKNISGGPYSDPDDWWEQRVNSGFLSVAAGQMWVVVVPLLNAVVCFYLWLLLGRVLRAGSGHELSSAIKMNEPVL